MPFRLATARLEIGRYIVTRQSQAVENPGNQSAGNRVANNLLSHVGLALRSSGRDHRSRTSLSAQRPSEAPLSPPDVEPVRPGESSVEMGSTSAKSTLAKSTLANATLANATSANATSANATDAPAAVPPHAFWSHALNRESRLSAIDEKRWELTPFDDAEFVETCTHAQDLFAQGLQAVPYLEMMVDGKSVGLNKRPTGIETEVDCQRGVTSDEGRRLYKQITGELYRQKQTRFPEPQFHGTAKRVGYSNAADAGVFELEPNPPRGRYHVGEWVSRIFAAHDPDWDDLRKALNVIKDSRVVVRNGEFKGTTVNERTGTHINFDITDYQDNLLAYTNLLNFFDQFKDEIFRLCNRPRASREPLPLLMSRTNRQRSSGLPMLRPLAFREPNEPPPRPGDGRVPYRHVGDLVFHQMQSQKQAIHIHKNFDGDDQAKAYAEIRIPDATLQIEHLQVEVIVFQGIFELAKVAAQEGRTLGSVRPAAIGAHYTTYGLGTRPGDRDFLDDTASFRAMLDELPLRKIEKAQATGLFAITQWLPPVATRSEANAMLQASADDSSG